MATEQKEKIKTVLVITLLIVGFHNSRQPGLTQFSKQKLKLKTPFLINYDFQKYYFSRDSNVLIFEPKLSNADFGLGRNQHFHEAMNVFDWIGGRVEGGDGHETSIIKREKKIFLIWYFRKTFPLNILNDLTKGDVFKVSILWTDRLISSIAFISHLVYNILHVYLIHFKIKKKSRTHSIAHVWVNFAVSKDATLTLEVTSKNIVFT